MNILVGCLIITSFMVYSVHSLIKPEKCKQTETGALFAHPYDCSQYMICDNGMLADRPCGPSTEWNDRLKVCDWPRNAGCKANSNTNSEPAASEHADNDE